MRAAITFACILVIISVSTALPVETKSSAVNLSPNDTVHTTLLDVDPPARSDDIGDELKREVRGLGLGGFGKGFGGGFGGLGGKFGSLGFGGHGLGGFGHGFGGLGAFKKPFLLKGF